MSLGIVVWGGVVCWAGARARAGRHADDGQVAGAIWGVEHLLSLTRPRLRSNLGYPVMGQAGWAIWKVCRGSGAMATLAVAMQEARATVYSRRSGTSGMRSMSSLGWPSLFLRVKAS
jgi:hypothetical protein